MRFFLIDRVTQLMAGQSVEGIKAWSLDNEIFRDHFPGQPIVPGVLLTESMAQLSGLLVEFSYYKEWGKAERVYPILSIIQKAKFRELVLPGDQTIVKANLISLDKNRAVTKVKIFVNEKLAAESTLSFSIAQANDVGYNKFFERRQEYYEIVLKDLI